MTPARLDSVTKLEELRRQLVAQRQNGKRIVAVCAGTGCQACGCEPVLGALRRKVHAAGLDSEVEIKATGCPGPCEWGPLLTIHPEKTFYVHVHPRDIDDIVDRTLIKGEILPKLLYQDPVTGQVCPNEDSIPFFRKQKRSFT